MNNMERELKTLVSKEQFEQLMTLVMPDECRIQINTYYDTPDGALKKQGIALRIRQIENSNILTMKKPLDAITKYEFERPVSASNLNELNQEEQQWIIDHLGEGHDLKQLKTVVTTTTERCIKKTDDAEICLDKTDFAHHTDYEIEYEYTRDHDGISIYKNLLNQIGITYEKNCPSKLARAVKDSVQ